MKITRRQLRQIIREELESRPSWKSKRWIFIDTETTGLDVKEGHRVWEIGWAYVNGMQVKARGSWIIDPGREMDPGASAITGVTSAEWAGKGSFETIAPKLARLIAHSDVVLAYNAPFDRAFITNEFKLAGVEMPSKPWLDPLVWVKKFVPSNNHRLKTMTDRYEIVLDRAHRADADAEAAALLTIKFLQAAEGASIVDDPHEVEASDTSWREEQRRAKFGKKR